MSEERHQSHEQQHGTHYNTNVMHHQQRIYPVDGQNMLLQQYPSLVGSSGAQHHHIPYSTSNNEAFNITNNAHNFHSDNGNGRSMHNLGPVYSSQNTTSEYPKSSIATASYNTENVYVGQDFIQTQLQSSQQHQQQQQQQHQQQQQQQQTDLTIQSSQQIEQLNKQTDTENGDDDSSDEDVHQCGRCKEVFRTLKEYMEHKTSKICKSQKNKQTHKQQQQPPQQQPQQTQEPQRQHQQQQQRKSTTNDPITSVANQNILEAAAKNTIFRDSFIPMEQAHISEEDGSNIWPKKNIEVVGQEADVLLKLAQEDLTENGVVKRKRGRPPKAFMNDTQDFGGLDSPPKAKRKSRPPRRHKPDYDPCDEAIMTENNNETMMPGAAGVQFFAGGRGRGRGRGRNQSHRCPICNLLFPSRTTMIEHKRKHTKIHKCKICNEGFYTEEKLERHSTKESHDHPCDNCERSFVNKQALLRHRLSHSEKIHKCEQCPRAFKTPRDLKQHVLGMHNECRDFVCEVCEKGFSRPEKLRRHTMIHAPDRPVFTCPFKNHVGCDKTFYRKDKLTRHLYSHSKVKPFKCDQCEKSFARTDNLREHIRSHTGVFRYYCTVCGKGQPGPKKFLQHMLKQHNVDNAEIPRPFEDIAPEPLIQQHKAVVEAETAARLARAATNLKKEREKTKARKDSLDASDLNVDAHHVTLANLGTMAIQAVNPPTLLSSPTQQGVTSEQIVAASRGNMETLYTINQSTGSGSPQFQINRQTQETLVRQVNEQLLREQLGRESNNREAESAQAMFNRHLSEAGEIRSLETSHLTTESLRREISESGAVVQARELDEQQQQQGAAAIAHTMTVDADGNLTGSGRGLHLLSQGVLPGHLQFTTLLNSDLVAIGEAVIRNPNGNGVPAMFQQKFGPSQ